MDIKEYKKSLPRPVYEVQETLQKVGYATRLASDEKDGKKIYFILTRNYREDRVNLTIKDEMVIDFTIG